MTSQASSAVAAAAAPSISNNLIAIERNLNYALWEKRICKVAVAALPILAGAVMFSGALALPHASFLISTGVPLAVILIAKLYFKALAMIEKCEPELEFEKQVIAYQDRTQVYALRGLANYIAARREISDLESLFCRAAEVSLGDAQRYGDVISKRRDQIEKWVLPDLLDALRIRRGCQKSEDFGKIFPLQRATRLEQDDLRATSRKEPSLYFSSKCGNYKASFVALNQILETWYQQHGKELYPGVTSPETIKADIKENELLLSLEKLIFSQPSSSGSFRA